jgi:hypothetical protein
MRPTPSSPLASLPKTGPTMVTPRRASVAAFAALAACCHMR